MGRERFIYFFTDGRSEIEGAENFSPTVEETASALGELVGGKGASLHAMTAMGFPVPPGFTIATSCCAAYYAGGGSWPEGLRQELAAALSRLEEVTRKKLGDSDNPLLVSVRSGASVSMPGMMDTVLNVGSRAGVEQAVERVLRSWQSDRAVTYRQQQAILRQGGTAVTVQQMCPAEVAGVAFTADPANGEAVVIVEAVKGLGEGVVSGTVTPDRYRLAQPSLELVAEHVAGNEPLLSLDVVRRIARVSLEVESRFGCPLDIEWAMADGAVFLLQARPVRRPTAAPSAQDLLTREVQKLRRFSGRDEPPLPPISQANKGRPSPSESGRDSPTRHRGDGAFVRHNLDETLCYPTPMTWDILSEFFKGSGGFGSLYRELGYRPSQRVMREGFLVTVCGRVYADLDRAAELFFPTQVIRYDAGAVRRQPDLLNEPPQRWDKGASPIAMLRTLYHCWRSGRRVERARREFLAYFRRDVLPPYLRWCRQKERQALSSLDSTQLLEELNERVQMVFGGFARNALQLSLLAGIAYADLRDFLERRLGEVPGRQATQALSSLLENDMSVEQNRALIAVGRNELAMREFLDRFGHRVAGEMELARPRWREDTAAVERLLASASNAAQNLEARIEERKKAVEQEERRLRELLSAGGERNVVQAFGRLLAEARALLPWRETGKHYWMLGYDLARRVLVELDRRLRLEGSIFYLTRAELSEMVAAGGTLTSQHRALIHARRTEQRLARSISLPDFITADDLECLAKGNRLEPAPTAPLAMPNALFHGTAIASGRGEGHAWICNDPNDACPVASPYVLVTSSTDPGWTPLVAGAQAMVVERGGALSHGAIVCRDFGVPAIVLPGATTILSMGDFLRVDGSEGTVTRSKEHRGQPTHSDGYSIPAEPYVRPVKPHLARRVAIGLATAILVSLVLVGVPELRAAVLPLVQFAYDWTLSGGFSPFWSITFASASAAGMAILVQMAILDRCQLRQMRTRLKWYRQQLKQAAQHSRPLTPREARLETAHLAERDGYDRALSTLQRRHSQASAQRSLELLRPVGWSFLPFCLACIWVLERFPAEPIRPGTSFTITAYFRPRPGNNYLRYARLDVPGAVRLLDDPHQQLRPNSDYPTLGPYKVTWSLEAVSDALATVAVTARDERWEQEVLVTDERRFAAANARRGRSDTHAAGEITEVRVDYPRVRVTLPDGAYRLLDSIARWLTGGRGITPEQAASGPLVLFLATAVVSALALQRVAGLR